MKLNVLNTFMHREASAHYASFLATRRALAIMVRVGLTAPMEGKRLESTT